MKKTIVITSIAGDDNEVLKKIGHESKNHDFEFIVVGDKKSPKDFKIENCEFLSVEDQLNLNFELSELLPFNHYSRKNIGYLKAIESGSKIIIDTDDDNIPLENFWNIYKSHLSTKTIEDASWVNIYDLFSSKKIWPRGYPIELLAEKQNYTVKEKSIYSPIQQGLADQNPDVDALYRMLEELPIEFDQGLMYALGTGSWCPFNSQNTVWYEEAFHLLYLPSFCSFRMTDIWRSFIAQVIAYHYGWHILFYSPTVYQERNPHNLLKDFEDEVPGYLNNYKIIQELTNVKLDNDLKNLPDNLLRLYEVMVQNKFIGDDELQLVEAWNKGIELIRN